MNRSSGSKAYHREEIGIVTARKVKTTGMGERVASDVSREQLWDTVGFLSDIDRPSGSVGENQGIDYIVDKLQAYGVDTTVYEFDSFLSHPIAASLEVIEPEQRVIECKTHSFGRDTGPEGITLDLSYIEDMTDPAATDKCNLVDGLVSPNKVLEGVSIGTAALIFCNPDEILHEMIVTTVWGTPTPRDTDRIPDLPIVSVKKGDAEYLKGLLAKGPVKVKVVAKVKTGWQKLRMPVGYIPGTEEADKYIVVGGHIDSWHKGTTDNATGNASVLELARVFNLHRDVLKRGIMFTWWPGHSTGRYSGSTWFVDNLWPELHQKAIAYFNIDSPGARNASEYVARHTSAEFEQFNVAMMQAITEQDVPVQRPSRAADQSFVNIGVPSLAAYSFIPLEHPDRRAYTGGSAGGKWWHNETDTVDKASPEVLEFDTKLAACIIGEIVTARLIPVNFETVAEDFEEGITGLAPAAKDFGLCLEPIEEAVKEFRSSLRALETVKGKILAGEDASLSASELNVLFLKLSRKLGPALAARRSPSDQDPADKVPILYGEQKPLLPSIRAMLSLTDTELNKPTTRLEGIYSPTSEDVKGFALAQMIRQRNRITTALREAAELISLTLGGDEH